MKILLSSILLLCWSCSFAQLSQSGSVELGIRKGVYSINQESYVSVYRLPDSNMYADIQLNFTFKRFTFTQRIENNFYYRTGKTLTPVNINFASEISYTLKKITIGYFHSCLHPVVSERENLNNPFMRASVDKIFIKYSWN